MPRLVGKVAFLTGAALEVIEESVRKRYRNAL